MGFLLDVKCSDSCLLIYGRATGREFPFLLGALERHVGLEEALH